MPWKIQVSEAPPPAKEGCLTREECVWWIEAIINDDSQKVISELESANHDRRDRLLNGCLEVFKRKLPHVKLSEVDTRLLVGCNLSQPWCLAGAYGSHQVLKAFLQFDVDVCQEDQGGTNILHALVKMAALVTDNEEQAVTTYQWLKEALSGDKLRCLLLQENHLGVRPVELASHLGCFALVQAYLETEDVYLVQREQYGFFNVEYFDVTDYESLEPGNRRALSPLVLSIFVDRRCTERASTAAFFESDLIKNWQGCKLHSNRIPLTIWFLVRLLMVLGFVAYDLAGGWSNPAKVSAYYTALNQSDTNNSTFLHDYSCWVSQVRLLNTRFFDVITGVFLISNILLETVEVVRCIYNPVYRRLISEIGRKQLLVNMVFYRFVQWTLFITLCVNIIATNRKSVMLKNLLLSGDVQDIIYVLSSFCCLWSILFFLQALPWLGFFIITIQHMVEGMVRFCAILFFFLTPLALCLNRIIVQNVRGPCPPQFANGYVSIYSTFIVVFNMVNFMDLNLERPFPVYLFHAVFLLLSTILLLNFIIAMFTNTAAFVQENHATISFVQKMMMCWSCEDRLSCIVPYIVHRLHQRYFLYDSGTGRFYITRVKAIQRERNPAIQADTRV